MKEFNIEKILEVFHYDSEQGKLFWKIRRSNNTSIGDEAGWVSSDGYRKVTFEKREVRAHRIIFFIEHGFVPDIIDHVNGNKLDNRIYNLRACSKSQNGMNRGKQKNNSSGVSGVCWNKSANKWQAYIKVDGKQIYLGVFADKLAAAEAVSKARTELHQDFAFAGIK